MELPQPPRVPSTALVVDDEAILRTLTRRVLESLGVPCVEAESGELAIARCDGSVGLVLLDIMMPGLDGLATCRRLRALPRETPLAIWFLTGGTALSDADIAAAGGDGLLVRPVSRGSLQKLVDDLGLARP